jgi:hypothetical protein
MKEAILYIPAINEELTRKFNEVCNIYKIIGFKHETPRYFNFKGFDMDTKILKIGSTQTNIFFEIQTDFDFIHSNEFWPEFKEWRTNFLKANHPTIETI